LMADIFCSPEFMLDAGASGEAGALLGFNCVMVGT
jgi:hypothetical protein